MTHLKIEQNNIQETVTGSIIEALYNIAVSGKLDDTSDLKGVIYSPTGYRYLVEYLNNAFNDLTVTVGDYYIKFADPAVQAVFASSSFGDGTGIKESSAARIYSVAAYNGGPNAIMGFNDSEIEYFNELAEFPNLKSINERSFISCKKLKEIDCSNITWFGLECFANCSDLENINMPTDTSFAPYMFVNDLKIVIDLTNYNASTTVNLTFAGGTNLFFTYVTGDVNMPNLELVNRGLSGTNISRVISLGKVTYLGGDLRYGLGAFAGCKNLTSVVLPDTLQNIYGFPFSGCSRLQWVKCLATTPPTLETPYRQLYSNIVGWGCPVYVPDESLDAYKEAEYWSDFASSIKPLSEFPSD